MMFVMMTVRGIAVGDYGVVAAGADSLRPLRLFKMTWLPESLMSAAYGSRTSTGRFSATLGMSRNTSPRQVIVPLVASLDRSTQPPTALGMIPTPLSSPVNSAWAASIARSAWSSS